MSEPDDLEVEDAFLTYKQRKANGAVQTQSHEDFVRDLRDEARRNSQEKQMKPSRYTADEAAPQLDKLARAAAQNTDAEPATVITDAEGQGLAVLMGTEAFELLEERISTLQYELNKARGVPMQDLDDVHPNPYAGQPGGHLLEGCSVPEVRDRLEDLVERCAGGGRERTTITNKGAIAAVLINPQELEELEDELALFKHQDWKANGSTNAQSHDDFARELRGESRQQGAA